MPTNKQRRDTARRNLEQELQQRAKRDAARTKTTLIASIAATVAVLAAVLIVIVVTSGDDGGTSVAANRPANPGATAAQPSAAGAAGSCEFTAQPPAARKVAIPPAQAPTSGTVTVALSTNQGDLTFTLDRAKAPCTVESFASLVAQKYYDDTPCHRLTTQGIYVLQCGDPTGSGSGGPGYTIPDEVTGAEQYATGVLAMANTGAPHSGGGQFFIVYKDTQLAPNYTVFGTVTKGIDIVQKVAEKGSDNGNGAGDGHPNLPVQITSAKVVK